MLKKIILLALFIISINAFSQEIINSFPMKVNSKNIVFELQNDSTQTTTLFNISEDRILAIQLNKNKKIIDSISTDLLEEKQIVICSNQSKNSTTLYCRNQKSDKIFALTFDFLNKKTNTKNLALDLKKDTNIFNFSQNNKTYFLSTTKGASELKIDIIDLEGNATTQIIDISNFKLVNYYNQPTTLYKSIGSFYNTADREKIAIIDSKTNLNLIEAAKKTKLYIRDNKLIFTFDISKATTQVFTVNLKDYTATVKQIATPIIGAPMEVMATMESNSFLIDDKLFQFKLSETIEIITVKDLTGNLLNSYTLKSEGKVSDNSNTYYAMSPTDTAIKEIKNSKDFLERSNKFSYGAAIFGEKVNDEYHITFGATSEAQGAILPLFGILPFIGPIGFAIIVSIDQMSDKSSKTYQDRFITLASLKIDGQIKEFSNRKTDFKDSEMNSYISRTKKILKFTFSKSGEKQILGFYDEASKTYNFKQFNN